MFPDTGQVFGGAETRLNQHLDDPIQRHIQTTDEFIRQVSQQGMKGVNSCTTEHLTGATPPWLPKQYPEAIIIGNLELSVADLCREEYSKL